MNPLNLEAAVLVVCSLCARCGSLWRVLGVVVAGRFWCSYAWVSLTQTACARPRGCACACACVCAGVCVPIGGVRRCAAVCGGGRWCVGGVLLCRWWWVVWRHTSFSLPLAHTSFSAGAVLSTICGVLGGVPLCRLPLFVMCIVLLSFYVLSMYHSLSVLLAFSFRLSHASLIY